MPRHRVLALLVLALLAAGCGDDGGDDAEPDPTTTTTPTTTTVATAPPSPPSSVPATDVSAVVFFTRDGTVATAGRAVEPPAVAAGALEALLGGPDDLEAGLGMTSAIPPGTQLLGVTIEDGLATVDVSGAFLADLGDDTALRVAQVVFTATQFPTVDRVTLQIESVSAPTVGLDAVPVVAVDRSDFEEQTPFILVESPTPGEAVTSPLRVTGLSNTFEATLVYEITGAGGQVVDDGFTTATAGTGTWGTFDFTADPTAGDVVLTVFQESAEDGSRIDQYEVPLVVG